MFSSRESLPVSKGLKGKFAFAQFAGMFTKTGPVNSFVELLRLSRIIRRSFHFVECGADEQPLLDIVTKNAELHREVIEAGRNDRIDQVNRTEEEFDPVDADPSGDVSKAERKKWNKEHPGEGR